VLEHQPMGKRKHEEDGEGGGKAAKTDAAGESVKDEVSMTREERRKMFWEQRRAAAEARSAAKAGKDTPENPEASDDATTTTTTTAAASSGGAAAEGAAAAAAGAAARGELSEAAQIFMDRILAQGVEIAKLKNEKASREDVKTAVDLLYAAKADYKAETGEDPPKKKRQRGGKKGKKREHAHGDRYLLFVGNLSFQTKREHIQKHFGRFGGLIDVRLLTDKVTKKPKGTAFIEFDNQEAHGKALGLHHTKMTGRVINVELTVGGGGKSQNRTDKLKRKNSRHLGIGGPQGINAIPLGTRKVPAE